MYDGNNCIIFLKSGIQKFEGEIETNIREIFPTMGVNKYIVINANGMENVRLVKIRRRYGVELVNDSSSRSISTGIFDWKSTGSDSYRCVTCDYDFNKFVIVVAASPYVSSAIEKAYAD